MTGWAGLDRLLDVDPKDGGCGHAMELLHVYGELLAANRDAATAYPAVAAHLAACGPCHEDLAGLLALLREQDTPPG